MADPSVRGVATATGSTSTLTPTNPSVAGDLLLLLFSSPADPYLAVTWPTGFTGFGNTPYEAVASKPSATGAESLTTTWTGGDSGCITAVAVQDGRLGATATLENTDACPSVTSVGSNALIFRAKSAFSYVSGWTVPAGYTEDSDVVAAADGSHTVAHILQAVAGAAGTAAFTPTDATDVGVFSWVVEGTVLPKVFILPSQAAQRASRW